MRGAYLNVHCSKIAKHRCRNYVWPLLFTSREQLGLAIPKLVSGRRTICAPVDVYLEVLELEASNCVCVFVDPDAQQKRDERRIHFEALGAESRFSSCSLFMSHSQDHKRRIS